MLRALEGLDGVKKVVMRFEDKAFDVSYDPAKVDPAKMCETVQALGFEAGVSFPEEK